MGYQTLRGKLIEAISRAPLDNDGRCGKSGSSFAARDWTMFSIDGRSLGSLLQQERRTLVNAALAFRSGLETASEIGYAPLYRAITSCPSSVFLNGTSPVIIYARNESQSDAYNVPCHA